MTISIPAGKQLSQSEYENLRFALIAQFEGKKVLPYFDTADTPKITIREKGSEPFFRG
ncbi:hypothetical protein ACFL4M_02910 [Pseudomonadota bacterium]